MNLPYSVPTAIAEELNKIESGWFWNPPVGGGEIYNARIIHKDGRRLWIFQKGEKFKICGSVPENCFLSTAMPEIMVSQSRTPEAIAKDISRRLLPEYRTFYDELVERIKQQNDHQKKLDSIKEHFESLIGEKFRSNGILHFKGWQFSVRSDGIRIEEGNIKENDFEKFIEMIR